MSVSAARSNANVSALNPAEDSSYLLAPAAASIRRRPRNQLATTRTATASQITRTPSPNLGRARYSGTFRFSPLDSLLEKTPERERGWDCSYAGLHSADRAFL